MACLLIVVHVLRNDLLWAILVSLMILWAIIFAGRNVELRGDVIVLKWGYLLERTRVLHPGEILDVVDASRMKHLKLMRYMPEGFLAVLVFILLGLVEFSLDSPEHGGFGWILFGGSLLVENSFSQAERKKAVLLLSLLISSSIVLDYLMHGHSIVLFWQLLFLFVILYVLWSSGPIANNLLLLITSENVYSVIYGSGDEIKELLRIMGREKCPRGVGGSEL